MIIFIFHNVCKQRIISYPRAEKKIKNFLLLQNYPELIYVIQYENTIFLMMDRFPTRKTLSLPEGFSFYFTDNFFSRSNCIASDQFSNDASKASAVFT